MWFFSILDMEWVEMCLRVLNSIIKHLAPCASIHFGEIANCTMKWKKCNDMLPIGWETFCRSIITRFDENIYISPRTTTTYTHIIARIGLITYDKWNKRRYIIIELNGISKKRSKHLTATCGWRTIFSSIFVVRWHFHYQYGYSSEW